MNHFKQIAKSLTLGAVVAASLLAAPALADENTPASFIYVPSEGNFSQFMVEDLYPTRGDHDFNDALVAVHQVISLNSDGDALGVMLHMKVIASGARLSNNIGITLPIDPANIVAYKDNADAVADIDSASTVSAWGTETNATYTLVTDTNAEFSSSNIVNTRPDYPTEDSTEYRFTFNFTSPQTLDTTLAPFDIFLFRDRGDGTNTEVHLADYPGTTQAYDFTGLYDDGSTGSRHFVDTNGVPFALLLPAETAYPKEGVAISALFPNIVTFGTSAGTSATDFYLSPQAASQYSAPSGSSIPTGDFLGFSAGNEQSLPASDVCLLGSSRTTPWCIPVATGSALEEILPIESGNGWVQSTSGMSFGWGAGNPAFTTARKTAGSSSIKIRKGTTWYFSPQFDTADLSEVGSEIEVDLYWPSNGANWWKVRLEFRTPTGTAIVLGEKTMGNEGPSTGWNTLNWNVPSSVRNILLGDNANYQFVFYTNNGWPANPNTHHLDYLRFAGTMTPHTTAHQEGSQGYSVATNDLMNFESTGDWSTTGASSLVTSPVSSGTKALSFYASSSGTTFITSADFSTTTLPTPTSTMGFDLYVPAPGSNPWWVGTITLKAKCPTAGISSWTTIGSGNSMANLFFGEYNHFTGNVPSNLLAAFQGTNTCALRIQMDGGQNVSLAVDRIGFR
jgi:LruC domain-containing protein